MITKFFDLGECQFSRDLALCRTDLAEEKEDLKETYCNEPSGKHKE